MAILCVPYARPPYHFLTVRAFSVDRNDFVQCKRGNAARRSCDLRVNFEASQLDFLSVGYASVFWIYV